MYEELICLKMRANLKSVVKPAGGDKIALGVIMDDIKDTGMIEVLDADGERILLTNSPKNAKLKMESTKGATSRTVQYY